MECKTCAKSFLRKDSRYYLKLFGTDNFFCSKECLRFFAVKTALRRIVYNTEIILDATSCWNYKKLGQDGYGKVTYLNRTLRAHRVVMHLVHGFDLDSKLQMCHHCDNPACIRPSHLFPDTGSGNAQDKVNKGRVPKVKRSKSTGTRLAMIEEYLKGEKTMKEIGKEFNISAARVCLFLARYKNGEQIDVQNA